LHCGVYGGRLPSCYVHRFCKKRKPNVGHRERVVARREVVNIVGALLPRNDRATRRLQLDLSALQKPTRRIGDVPRYGTWFALGIRAAG